MTRRHTHRRDTRRLPQAPRTPEPTHRHRIDGQALAESLVARGLADWLILGQTRRPEPSEVFDLRGGAQ